MDAYEATRIVFSRIQVLEPEHAAKIMGLLLIQDHGEKEMIRLAFGPETVLRAVIAKARNELGLLLPHSPSSSRCFAAAFPHIPPPPLSVNSPSWAPPSPDDFADQFEQFTGVGWKPCLYYARGYCKNGTACRFSHGDDDIAAVGQPDVVSDCGAEQLQLLRWKSQRMAAAFPYSPTASSLWSPSSNCMSFLLQQQQNDSQRATAAAVAAALMLNGDENHKLMPRCRMDRADFAGMANPGSRQIYLTFPADSTFSEEDVSNYFSIYGPVQDVRIPYQQKRMFGFVTFVYPETVRLILAKGNPHFVCDARVLVKPYKEKGKVPDKKQQQQGERGDFSSCNSPTGFDSRDPYDLQQLGTRMLYSSSSSPTQEMFLRRKLVEQQQAAELQQAIELQGRRFMGLQLMDFKSRSFSQPITINPSSDKSHEESSPEDKSPSPASSGGEQLVNNPVNVAAVTDKEESAREASPKGESGFQESADHNLPDSPFASPTKASAFAGDFFAATGPGPAAASPNCNGSHLIAPSLNVPSFKSCLFQMPRFSSGHGAVGLQ